MSYDFALIPVESFTTADDARQICDLLFAGPQGSPAPSLAELIDQLERDDAIGDDGFLSVWPVDADARGAVLCTRRYKDMTYTMMELTKDRGLTVIDMQTERLYDPRGRAEVQVQLGDGTDLPYLTPSILADLVTGPHRNYPWLVVSRGDQQFIQAYFAPDGDSVIEYRDGGPDRHYRATTADRSVVRQTVWEWTQQGFNALAGLEWARVDPAEFEG